MEDRKENTRRSKQAEAEQNRGQSQKKPSEKEPSVWCTGCGRRIPADSIYCEFCGEKIEIEIARGDGNKKQEEARIHRAAVRALLAERAKKWKRRALEFLNAGPAGKKRTRFLFLCAGGCGILILLAAFGHEDSGSRDFFGYVKDNSLYAVTKNGKVQELTDYYLADWKKREDAGLSGKGSCAPISCNNGDIIWYPQKIGTESFTLMCRVKGKEQRIDSGAVSFQAAGTGAVYQKNNGGLYEAGTDGRDKLSAGATFYLLADDGESVLWEEENPDNSKGLFWQELHGRDQEKTLIEKDAAFLDASGDLENILYQKDGSLWSFEGQGKKKMEVEEVSQIFLPDAENKTCFFTRKDEWGESLYYLGTDGRERLIDREFLFLIHGEDGLLTYKAMGEDGREEIRIASDFSCAGTECSGETQITREGNWAWYTAQPDSGSLLSVYRISLAPETFGRTEEMAQDVAVWYGEIEGMPLYLKNAGGNTGDLYLGTKRVAYDVRQDSVTVTKEGSEKRAYCIGAYDGETESGTLLELTGNKAEKISENVSGYSVSDEGILFCFSDYDPSGKSAKLSIYDSRKKRTEFSESDVWGCYGGLSQEKGVLLQTEVYQEHK